MPFVAVAKFTTAAIVATLITAAVPGAAEARDRNEAVARANAIANQEATLWAVRQAEQQLRPRAMRLISAGPLAPLALAVASAVTDPSRYIAPVAVKLHDENRNIDTTIMMPVDGVLDPESAGAAAKFFRCRRTDRSRMIDRGTLAMLTDVAQQFPGKTIGVVSAYRNYAGESLTSPHRGGRAIDFRIQGVSTQAIRDYMWRSYSEVGVGWYPHEDFVHIDHRTGDKDMPWTFQHGDNKYHPHWANSARRESRSKPTS